MHRLPRRPTQALLCAALLVGCDGDLEIPGTPTAETPSATETQTQATTPSDAPPTPTTSQSPSPTPAPETPTPTATVISTPTLPPTPTATPTALPRGQVAQTWEALGHDATTFALALPDHGVLMGEAGGGLSLRDPVGWWGAPPAPAPGTPTLGAWMGEGRVLLGTAGGSYLVEGARISPSGLDDALGAPLEAILPAPAPGGAPLLWMTTATQLHQLVEGERLKTFGMGALPVADAHLAWGPEVPGAPGVAGEPALWVASGGALYGLTPAEGGGLSAWQRPLPGGAARDIAAAGGRLYALGAEGDLYRLGEEGWARLPTEEAFIDLAGRVDLPGLWLLDAEGGLRMYRPGEGLLRPEPMEDRPPGEALLGVDDEGRVLLLAEGLYRVVEGRPLFIHGIEEGGMLEASRTFTLLPTLGEAVVSLTLALDGEALLSASEATASLSLSPLALTPGAHRLEGEALYGDGAVSAGILSFFSIDPTPPTWEGDIEPIATQSCGACHGPGGFAHALYSAEAWEAEVENILIQVEAGAMPLSGDALSADQIATIRAWADTGFGRE